jgi:hypothetical protein
MCEIIEIDFLKQEIISFKDIPDVQAHEDKIRYENLTEKQIDKILKDSFPASDPPGTY